MKSIGYDIFQPTQKWWTMFARQTCETQSKRLQIRLQGRDWITVQASVCYYIIAFHVPGENWTVVDWAEALHCQYYAPVNLILSEIFSSKPIWIVSLGLVRHHSYVPYIHIMLLLWIDLRSSRPLRPCPDVIFDRTRPTYRCFELEFIARLSIWQMKGWEAEWSNYKKKSMHHIEREMWITYVSGKMV